LASKTPGHQRFYCPPETIDSGSIDFSPQESLHMVASLRLKKGERITATDGEGRVYEVVIEEARRRRVRGRITNVSEVPRSLRSITLFQGIIKAAAMELALTKCAELGVSAVVPVVCENSVGSRSGTRLGRLRRISVEAMKQSLGAYLTVVHEPAGFEDALAASGGFDSVLVAWEGEGKRGLASALETERAGTIALWTGPEGGFARAEIDALVDIGAVTFSLGERRLRAETAAIAAVAVIGAWGAM
jgi:16S rRNA (uracil1498-N3)-methyltransferase